MDTPPMLLRRSLAGLIVSLMSACMAVALWRVLAPGGWTGAKVAMLLSGLGAAPWVGFCVANGLIGFVLSLTRPAVPVEIAVTGTLPHTAIAVTVRNEDMDQVLPPLRGAGFASGFLRVSADFLIRSNSRSMLTSRFWTCSAICSSTFCKRVFDFSRS